MEQDGIQDGLLRRGARRRSPVPTSFEIEGWHGGTSVIEDPYRFAPIITDFDLHLHGEGTLYEAWNTLGAHLARRSTASRAFASPSGRRTPNSSPWPAISMTGTRAAIPCGCRNARRLGDLHAGRERRAIPTSTWCARSILGHQQLKADPFGFRSEVPPEVRVRSFAISTATRGTTPHGWTRAANATG